MQQSTLDLLSKIQSVTAKEPDAPDSPMFRYPRGSPRLVDPNDESNIQATKPVPSGRAGRRLTQFESPLRPVGLSTREMFSKLNPAQATQRRGMPLAFDDPEALYAQLTKPCVPTSYVTLKYEVVPMRLCARGSLRASCLFLPVHRLAPTFRILSHMCVHVFELFAFARSGDLNIGTNTYDIHVCSPPHGEDVLDGFYDMRTKEEEAQLMSIYSEASQHHYPTPDELYSEASPHHHPSPAVELMYSEARPHHYPAPAELYSQASQRRPDSAVELMYAEASHHYPAPAELYSHASQRHPASAVESMYAEASHHYPAPAELYSHASQHRPSVSESLYWEASQHAGEPAADALYAEASQYASEPADDALYAEASQRDHTAELYFNAVQHKVEGEAYCDDDDHGPANLVYSMVSDSRKLNRLNTVGTNGSTVYELEPHTEQLSGMNGQHGRVEFFDDVDEGEIYSEAVRDEPTARSLFTSSRTSTGNSCASCANTSAKESREACGIHTHDRC